MSAHNFIILDIETNGEGPFRPGRQRPIQVSFLKCDAQGNILKEYSQFVKGVKTIVSPVCPKEWSLNYINANGIDMDSIVKDIEDTIDEHTIIVGHNIQFDIDCIVYLTIFQHNKQLM